MVRHLSIKTQSRSSWVTHLLKSFSVSRASSPWPRRSKWRSSMSKAMIFSKSWFNACGKRVRAIAESSSCQDHLTNENCTKRVYLVPITVQQVPSAPCPLYHQLVIVRRTYLVRMGHKQRSLFWKIVIKVGDNLYSDICFACTWRSHNLQQSTKQHKA